MKISLSGIGAAREMFEAMPERVRAAFRDPALHEQFVAAIIADARERIDAGGKPTAFAPLSKQTLRRKKSNRILRETSVLYNSLNYAGSEGNTAYLGAVRYFFAHQFGTTGAVSVKAHSTKDKRGNIVQGKGKKKVQTASGVGFRKAHLRRQNTPARPMVVITPELLQELGDIAGQFIVENG